MKKIFILILAMALILSAACLAHADSSWYCSNCGKTRTSGYCPDCGARRPSGSWDEEDFSGTGTALKSNACESFRYQSYFGPGKSYPDAGAYKPYKVTSMKALFREGDFVYVDMSYRTVGRRCLYFRANALTNDDVDERDLVSCSARTTKELQPRFGPGNEYDGVIRTSSAGKTYKVKLRKNTAVEVFFETDGWVFAEFSCELGTIRAWIPASQVKAA